MAVLLRLILVIALSLLPFANGVSQVQAKPSVKAVAAKCDHGSMQSMMGSGRMHVAADFSHHANKLGFAAADADSTKADGHDGCTDCGKDCSCMAVCASVPHHALLSASQAIGSDSDRLKWQRPTPLLAASQTVRPWPPPPRS